MSSWKQIAAVAALVLFAGAGLAAEYDGTFLKAEDKKLHVTVDGQERIWPFDAETAFTNEKGVALAAGVKSLVARQHVKISTKDKNSVETVIRVRVIQQKGD